MFYKNGTVIRNLENGHTFAVRPVSDERSQTTYEVISTIPVPGVGLTVMQDGYATEEAAQEALDAFLAEQGVPVVELADPRAQEVSEGVEEVESPEFEAPVEEEPVTPRRGRNR